MVQSVSLTGGLAEKRRLLAHPVPAFGITGDSPPTSKGQPNTLRGTPLLVSPNNLNIFW